MAAVLMLLWLQSAIIFPGHMLQGRARARVVPPPGAELLTLRTEGGERVAALYAPALSPRGRPHPQPSQCPTVLYLYGNYMCLADALPQVEAFRRLGANVLVPDYVGYGLSSGKPSEAACYATADAAYDYLTAHRGVPPSKLVPVGWSLGGAAAIDLASRRRVGGLAAFSTFTCMADMARQRFPFLPVAAILRHRFDSASKLPSVRCPILLGHGRQDRVVPLRVNDRLAAAARSPVTRLVIDQAGHNDFFKVGGEQVAEALHRFLASL